MKSESRNNIVFFLVIGLILISIFFFNKNVGEKNNNTENISSEDARNIIAEKTELVLKALKFKNIQLLSNYVHPKKGITISPFSYILSSDITIKKRNIIKEYTSNKIRKWGNTKDSVAITLSFKEYLDTYIYSHDFDNYDKLLYNQDNNKLQNIISNINNHYPNSIKVEYLLNDQEEWNSLKLIYEKYKKKWYLTGIINVRGSYS